VSGIEALLIAGPTASGKSALAIRLAKRFGGVVINADSMQVYGDLRIITARPSPEEEAMVPHRFFGHVDAATNYSVARWLDDARDAIAEARAQGLLPIITGGTGLYFRALLEGLSNIPPVPASVRERIRAEAEDCPPETLHARLAALDPITAARLRPSDPQRIIRALEVVTATGQPLASFHGPRQGAVLDPARCKAVFLEIDRGLLRHRIDNRFLAMMEEGALDEVRHLAERRLDPALPAMRAHGVPGLIAALAGQITLDEAVMRGQGDTRRYAKRQHTWFRHQLPAFAWAPVKATEQALASALAEQHSGLDAARGRN
jgi:tRNA dimethylallyltransferase